MDDGIVMRVHRVRAEVVVAACDADLLGSEIPVGSSGRTVRISSQFYGERRVTAEEFLLAARRATIVNLLGPRVLAVAEREGMIAPGGAGSLGGVPHAEIFTIEE
ncbi:MAG TPA: DUF424 family protein [Thermoplasmata archaeon]|nr:DUF424 family protein [Thermoplasmata archaeon]